MRISELPSLTGRISLGWKFLKFRMRYRAPTKMVRPRDIPGTFFSQAGQDVYVAAMLFGSLDRAAGQWVIDVGANHPIKYSNSYFFEKYFGCRTLAIDPLSEFEGLWKDCRPKAEFIPMALGSRDASLNINIPIAGNNMYASFGGVAKEFHEGRCEERSVSITTLRRILEDRRITEVLFMSIDVEGFELEVLKGIDFDKVKFKAILCENNSDGAFGSNAVREFLIEKKFVYHARIGRLDDLFISPSIGPA